MISSALLSLCTESEIRRLRLFTSQSVLLRVYFLLKQQQRFRSLLCGRKIGNRIHFKKNNISRPNIMLTVIEYIMRVSETRTKPRPT